MIARTPLYTGGKLEGELDAARAKQRQDEAVVRERELDLTRGLMDAYQSMKTARAKLAVSEEQVAFAKDALSYAVERYKVKLGSYLDVSTAQTGLTKSLANLARNRFQYQSTEAALSYATGKDCRAYVP